MHLSPHQGPKDPSTIQSSLCVLMCLCISIYRNLCMFLCLFVRINFWQSKSVARNCAQRMRPQTMGSNTLSGSIIFMLIRPPCCLRTLLRSLYLDLFPVLVSSIALHLFIITFYDVHTMFHKIFAFTHFTIFFSQTNKQNITIKQLNYELMSMYIYILFSQFDLNEHFQILLCSYENKRSHYTLFSFEIYIRDQVNKDRLSYSIVFYRIFSK